MEDNNITIEENVTVNEEVIEAVEEIAAEEAAAEARFTAEEPEAEAEEAAEEAAEEEAAEEEALEEEAAEEEADAKETEDAAEKIKAQADDIVAKVKDIVKEGNVTFIRIRKDNTVILNLPMTVGIIGTVLGLAAAPWMVILATITTVGLKCTVEVEKKDGSIVTIHGKE